MVWPNTHIVPLCCFRIPLNRYTEYTTLVVSRTLGWAHRIWSSTPIALPPCCLGYLWMGTQGIRRTGTQGIPIAFNGSTHCATFSSLGTVNKQVSVPSSTALLDRVRQGWRSRVCMTSFLRWERNRNDRISTGFPVYEHCCLFGRFLFLAPTFFWLFKSCRKNEGWLGRSLFWSIPFATVSCNERLKQ